MLPTLFNTAALALVATSLVSAQTSSNCNPNKGDNCSPDPAFGDGTVTVDFTKGESDVFKLADGTSLTYDGSNGAVFSISSETDAPTIISKKYLFFGRVDAVIQAAPGTGIVTSFTLQSDDLDEIDWEWVGSDVGNSQSNYFGKGDTTTYDRGAYHPTAAVTSKFHTYSIEWTAASIQWIIDGVTVRTLNYADAKSGTRYPQTPMQVRLGTWVGGSSTANEGTVAWAGGLATFDNAPFKGYYKSITIKDYSNGVSGAKEYSYSDASGDYSSITISTKGSDSGDDNSTTSTSKTVSTTATTATSATASSKTSASTTASDDTTSTSATSSGSDGATTMTTATKTDSTSNIATSSNNSTAASETSSPIVGESAAAPFHPASNSLFAAVILVFGAMVL